MAEDKSRLVGEVIHYYSKLKVAIIQLSDNLKLGDKISIEGYTTNLMQTVDSIQIDFKNVEYAAQGKIVGVKVEGRCRKGDEVKKSVI
jgi:putative protease